MVWQPSSAHPLLDDGEEGRGGGRVRPVGQRKIDLHQMRQRTRALPARRDHGGRHFRQRPENGPAEAARENRHGVPELRAVPAHERDPQPDPRAGEGPGAQPGGSDSERPQAARTRGALRAQGQVSRPALRGPAAARRDRPRARNGSDRDAVRRAHLGARPGDDQRGARRHGRARPRRHDHDGGHARDGFRQEGRAPRRLHGPRRDRRGRPEGRLFREAALGAGSAVPFQDSAPLTSPFGGNMPDRNVKLLFALFALSGFTGLIYESVWSHYLKLFLGAAAFAQSFVLAALMGGMALGAWLASRWSARLKNLLAAYGWIEAAIGVAALIFHESFVMLTQISLDHVIPALGSPSTVEIYKYSLCAVLIVPQTLLLGMTFPLLSGAVIRRGPEASGHHLAMLYFTNSIGAAAGALAAAFLLIGWLGMPGTMRFAGTLNLALAAAVLAIARFGEPAAVAAAPSAGSAPSGSFLVRLFLAGAFVTGLASFIYEIVWIRMLSLVLSSSFHSFELMLSAFITGLALGGLWIRRRIDHIADPVRFAGLVQVFMGLAALGTIFVYHWTFDWMAWVLGVLQRKDAAYPLFNLFGHALAFAVMLPATFLAGMTLPLFTQVLLRGGRGERAIGQVYAANTLGAIAGVLLAVHVLMPAVGLKLAMVIGAAIDILLGGWILRNSQAASRRIHAFAAILMGMLAATATARAAILEPERLSSGVFRYGQAAPEFGPVYFYRDGKTASVAVRGREGTLSILTNGKSDAALRLDANQPPTQDEFTMTLLGALPLLIKPDAKTFANIGWGSGLSVEVALSHSGPVAVDTVAIEPAMVAGAHSFLPRIERAYSDPRSKMYFEDAKSYFARHGKRYDVIMSEPSNVWVSGVAGLFTTEFYRDTKRYLAPGGLFVQWVHAYDLNDRLLGSVVSALGENFADYEIYETNPGDLIVVAVAEGRVPRPKPLPESEGADRKST